jgi:hypothetical protein
MIEPMKEMAGFIVMVFPLAQFVAMFNWSNMGKFMAVGLTDLLEQAGMNGVPAFVGLALLSAFLCMFIASGSAIWSILAPIFVPMFMLLGFIRPLRRFCSASPIRRSCRWRRYRRLSRCFLASCSAIDRMRNSAPIIHSFCLIR